MKPRARLAVAGLAAAIAGLLLAILISSAGADGTPAQTVVLGSVTGNPTATECPATVPLHLHSVRRRPVHDRSLRRHDHELLCQLGHGGGQVELRVLSSATPPHLNGEWTGAGTGPAETLKAGINTFAVNIPVKQGETIALDNDSGSPIFDNTSPFAQYASVAIYAPALPDGVTAYVNCAQNGYSLLMSATVVSGTTTSTTTTTTTTTQPPPVISGAFESHRSWREAFHAARAAPRRRARVGTTFAFTLDHQAATVDIELTHQLPGRRVGGACVAKNQHNRRAAVCTRAVREGVLVWAGHAGMNVVPFAGRVPGGRRLAPGSYVAAIIARNAAGQASSPVGLAFTILAG